MDTFEVQDCLCKINPRMRYNVYAANRLPLVVDVPTYLIGNLDPDTQPGSHWVAVHIDGNRNGEYFDSYGRRPAGPYHRFIKRNTRQWRYNVTSLQNELTSVCGEYCVMYLAHRYIGGSLDSFVNIFRANSPNTLRNDILVKEWFQGCFI